MSFAKAHILCPAKSSSRCVFTRGRFITSGIRVWHSRYVVGNVDAPYSLEPAINYSMCAAFSSCVSRREREALLTLFNHCRGRSVHLAKILRPCSTCRLIAAALRYNPEDRLISQLAPSSVLYQRERSRAKPMLLLCNKVSLAEPNLNPTRATINRSANFFLYTDWILFPILILL